MKKTFLYAVILGLLMSLTGITSAQTFHLLQGGYDGASFTVTVPMPTVKTQKILNSQYAVLSFEGATHLFREGEPDLPVLSQVIEIPLCSDVKVSVSGVQTKTLSLSELSGLPSGIATQLLPMQPLPSKSDLAPLPFVIDSALYATDSFYAAPEVAWVDRIGVARDRNLAVLRVSPLSYNPVTGEMVLVTSLQVTLTYEGADESATRELHRRYYSPAFSVGNNVMATLPADKTVADAAPLHYLIVAHNSFRGALDEFVAWKQRRGMIVTLAYTGDQGVGTTSTSIADYIKSFYTNATDELPAPTYLLLVGDNEQIPAFQARVTSPSNDHITDLYFVTWDGDNVPDCYRGRFSARTLAELTPQISKTLLYEGYNFTDPSFLGRGVLIAGEDGGYSGDNAYTYADPTMDYVAKTYVTAANGFTDIKYYKNNTSFAPTGVTVTGSSQTNATATALRSTYNQGCGWVNYSAHGSETSWGTPELTTSQVAQMTNNGKPGVFIGNCCLTGSFQEGNCLGESLLRKGNNAGAVAYIGATNSTYWPHDFCWSVGLRTNISGTMNTNYDATHLGMYDRLFHTHGERYTQWNNTLGSMVTSGNMAVEQYGSYALYYWEIYQLFGDPSLIPWLALPSNMPCDAPEVVTVGTTQLVFNTASRAYVALTTADDHELVTAAYADQTTGQVTLALPASITPGSYELAIWAQGYQPLFREMVVIVPAGPYLALSSLTPVSGKVVPGKANVFDAKVVNMGVSASGIDTLSFGGATEGVYSLLPQIVLPSIAPGDTLRLSSAASFYVPDSYTDGSLVKVAAMLQFDTFSTVRVVSLPVVAPMLTVSQVETSSAIISGETVTITCNVTNEGHDNTADLTLSLADIYALAATPASPVHVGVLAPDQSAPLSFTMVMKDSLPHSSIPFSLVASAEGYSSVVEELSFLGEGSAIEDFETGDFTRFNWTHSSNAWEITTSQKHSGTYSARSKSNLSNRLSSTLSIIWTSQVDDSISFWCRVSSEENYDFFRFNIDGSTAYEKSGVNTTWERVSVFVPAGTHVFGFVYAKDWSSSSGSDCVWLDDITLPFSGTPCTFLSDTVCQGVEYAYRDTVLPTDALGTWVYVDTNTTDESITWLALTVAEEPEVTITTSGNLVDGGRIVLMAHGANSYIWSTGDTTATIVVGSADTAVYTVTGFRGGCSGETTVTIAPIVGIDNSQLSTSNAQLSVYPNPTTGLVNVVCPAARRISVVNLMGQVLITLRYVSPDTGSQLSTLNLESLPNGVYFLKVETPDGTMVKKVVKK